MIRSEKKTMSAQCEADARCSLAQYESQLTTVEEALKLVTDENEKTELEDCRLALDELITITRDKLLNLKKARLITIYGTESNCNNSSNPITIDSSDSEQDQQASTSKSPDGSAANTGNDGGLLASIIGMHCKVPLNSAGLRYHSGLVYDVIVNDDVCDNDADGMDDLQVSVLFTRPLRVSMRPCEHFLNERCRFDNKCRYSHGQFFKFTEVFEDEEKPEWSASVGDKCLVPPDNATPQAQGVWRVGEITCLDEDKAAVRLIETGEECQAELKDLEYLSLDDFAQTDQYGGNNSLDVLDEESTSAAPIIDDFDDIDDETREERNNSAFAIGEIGSWEQHTKGIGSKLMSRMGYIVGQGLGKNKQGRLEPVKTTFCPKGKSLDKCMQLRLAMDGMKKVNGDKVDERDMLKLLKTELRRKRAKEKRRREKSRKQKIADEKDNVFDFLNKTLTHKGKGKGKSAGQMHKELKETTDKQLNVKLLQTDERISSLERDIHRYQEMGERLTNKDPNSAAKYKEKIAEARAKIAAIHRKKYQLANEKSKREGEKKLSIF